MTKAANPKNPISFKQFKMTTILLNTKEIDPNGTIEFDGVKVPMAKIIDKTVVTENGKTRNNWTNLPKLNAKMASDLIGFLMTLPNKGSNNGPVEGGTAAAGGWDSF